MEEVTQEQAIARVVKRLTEVNKVKPLFHSQHEGYAIMLEEIDELWKDVKDNKPLQAKNEAIDVAVTAIRFIMS